MAPSTSPVSAYLSYSLAAAHRKLSVELNRELKKMGVQIETWLVLQTLQTGEGYTMTELAGIVLMNPPTLTKLVDRMVAEGLVQRQLDVEDNRRVQLVLTDLGMDVCQKVTEHVEAQNDMIVRTIGEEKAVLLREVLETLA
ncbi:MarR family transcriptional regulator [Nitratireductor sp. XY-223]|uniref:MarR family winged helix-turn-helix transcriptional regulator n=1 Tax=Nitratireductor sp. XY-223 TaxID=2561926 RepID=UPI0010AAEB0E|nr:MarR family transcriptional regulator [Nitratireductor sp. XY-223]